MSKKSPANVVAARVEKVYAMRLGGAEFHDIVQFASAPEQAWGVSGRQVRNYIRQADQLMAERVEKRADLLLSRHLLQRRTLFARCVEAGDYSAALNVLKDEAALEGLYAPKKVALTDPSGTQPYAPTVTLTDADLAAAVAAVLGAAAAVGTRDVIPIGYGEGDAG